MKIFVRTVALASSILFALSTGAKAQEKEPDHIRGTIHSLNADLMEIMTNDGGTVPVRLPEAFTVIRLSKTSFTKVDFGVYVGSVAIKLEEFSPIVRDSMSWLHRGYELRIIDEKLRGIAVGHKNWSLTNETIIAHGWVDDIEGRVLSIKYGPTEEEETDVEVPRNVPVLFMTLADRSLMRKGAKVFAGANKDESGRYVAAFVFAGKDGVDPPL